MLALLQVAGLRRTELAGLKLSDYDQETRTLRIRGKGNKERRVFAEGGADLLLARWLELRARANPGTPLPSEANLARARTHYILEPASIRVLWSAPGVHKANVNERIQRQPRPRGRRG